MEKREDCGTEALQERALCVRRDIAGMPGALHDGYLFSAVSSVDLLVWLYGRVLRVRPEAPLDEGRDRFVLSRVAAAPALYATLAEYGFFPREELWEYRRLGGMLQSAPEFRHAPGIDVSCGVRGIGLGLALGLALALRDAAPEVRVVCLLGADELASGPVYETLTLAAEAALPSLLLIVESDGADADTERVLSAVGGCAAVRADGHDVEALNAAWGELTAESRGKGMRVLLARTVRGRGLPHVSDDLMDDEGPLDRQAADVLISGIRRELR